MIVKNDIKNGYVLFNPAVIGRSFDPVTEMGLISSKHRVILGVNDDVIDPIKSSAYFAEYGIGDFEYHREDIGHRIPREVFIKWIK